ncbi:MAG: hypothetical protein E8D52_00900 [Nitrospira sp.]|nr:MAG: hypothetical protein E8D52_00900 [Nitrospira sp.]
MWDFIGGPAFAVLIGSLLVAWATFWFRSPRKKRKRELLIFLGATVSIVAAFLASAQQAAQERRIAELNEHIASSITGGNSFAYITVLLQFNPPRLILLHQGEYPLYDVTVRIVDLEKTKQKGYSISDLENEVQFSIGNLAPHQSQVLKPISLSNDSLRWNIFFSARNQFFTELLRMRRIDNQWKTALKVINLPVEGEQSKTLLEKIDPGFPLEKSGHVDWEN